MLFSPCIFASIMRIEASANKQEATLYIYSEIGSYESNSRALKSMLDSVKEVKTLHVRIHSPGGNVFEGTAMYNLLRRFAGTVITHVDGLAASMATIIALAGSKVYMADNALFMIHNPSGGVYGEETDLLKVADLLKKLKEQLADVYVEKTGMDKAKILKMMADETWLTAKEAKALGFVDETGKSVFSAAAKLSLDNADVPAIYKAFTQPEDIVLPINSNMKISELLGLVAEATEDQIILAIKALQKQRDDLLASQKDAESKRLKEILDQAQLAGKIEPSARVSWEKMAETSGVDAVGTALQSVKSTIPISQQIMKKDQNAGVGREAWSFNDWRQNDPAGLKKMKSDNPDQYQALLAESNRTSPNLPQVSAQ